MILIKNYQIITVQIECNDLQAILKCLCKQKRVHSCVVKLDWFYVGPCINDLRWPLRRAC